MTTFASFALATLESICEMAVESPIMGRGFSFDLEVRMGAGAFVCGEETALIASIEGKRGEPRTRPPFPAVSGLWGKPTNINNVETWYNVAPIVSRGPAWFTETGSAKSAGTKVFSLVGKVNRGGLIEVPMGITIREIVEEIGGGIKGGRAFRCTVSSSSATTAQKAPTAVPGNAFPRN